MDQMLPSPSSFNIPSIGTPHHALEEDQMIAPDAQQAQQQARNNMYGFGSGFTPQSMLSASGQTPASTHINNMMATGQTPQSLLSSGATPSLGRPDPSSGAGGLGAGPVYAPVASPAPPSPHHQAHSLLAPSSHASQATSEILPQLQNIVSTVNMGVKLDLKKIALHARNAEYNPKRFAAVIMRIREPRTTALIFSSGKMVCTGAKSEEDSRLAARKYARIVQKLGFSTKFKDFKIQNMVGSCDVKFPIRLEGLVLTHSQFSSYEPELFPGLIYRMVKPRIVLLIFVSGKVVLTGAKVRQEIYEAFDNIYPILKNFKKQ